MTPLSLFPTLREVVYCLVVDVTSTLGSLLYPECVGPPDEALQPSHPAPYLPLASPLLRLTLNLSPDFDGPACVLSLTFSGNYSLFKYLKDKKERENKGGIWKTEGKGEEKKRKRGNRER